jgi:uncharacterized protein YgbK (DUF1537 family)
MPSAAREAGRVEAATYLKSLPPPLRVEGALGEIARSLAERDQCVAVVDDDPTGTQTVGDVPVLLRWSEDELLEAVRDPARVFFVLTNSRSLPEGEAAEVNEEIGFLLASVARKTGTDIRIVSRSDSTLRGHFPAETDALSRGWEGGGGKPFDGVLLCPQFFEAGRIVGQNTLWVRDGEGLVPAAQTEFAADPAFGYQYSNLLRWAAEKSGGEAPNLGVGIEDLRVGGVGRVEELLSGLQPGSVVAVDGVEYADLEVFVLGLLGAEAAGKRFLYRTGPSFVGVRSANRSGKPLTFRDIYGGRKPQGHGLVVVGSHTRLTTRQVLRATEGLGLRYVELDTLALASRGARREAELGRAAALVEEALASGDVLVATGREALRAEGGKEGALRQGWRISGALVELVRWIDPEVPLRYLVAKGGITSHDLAAHGLGAPKARVAGQMQRGRISLWRLGEGSLRPGLPYVVFPGNVGDDDALLEVLRTLRGKA